MTDARGGPLGGPNDWSAGFMPAAYQGTLFRSTGDPIVDLKPPASVTPEDQRAAARCAGEAQRAGHAAVSRQQRAGRAHLVLRAGLPDAGVRAERRRHRQRIGRDEEALWPRRQDHRAVRPAVPDGAPAGRARGAVRAGVLGRRRQPERRHVGRPRRHQVEPHAARGRDRSADGGAARRPEGARAARARRWSSCTRSSGACRFLSEASDAITTPARRRC